MGETIAEAPRPLLGTIEKAIPRTVAVAVPRRVSQRKVNHLPALVGRLRPKKATPKPSRRIICAIMLAITRSALPMK